MLTKRRQKAKELALSLAQSLLSQQAVLVQMAKKNTSSKEILEQHLKDIEELRHLVRMTTEEKLEYIPESVARMVANGKEQEKLKGTLLSIIDEAEKDLRERKHGIVQKKRLKLSMSGLSSSFNRADEEKLADEVLKKDADFITQLRQRVKEIEQEQEASFRQSTTNITVVTETLQGQLASPVRSTEPPIYNPGGLSHEDMNKSFSDVWDIYIEEYVANKGDNTKLGKINECAVITKAIVRHTLGEGFRFFDLTPNQYLHICKKYVAIPAGIGFKKVTKLTKPEFLKLTGTPPAKYKAKKTIKDFLETFNSFIGKMNQRYRGKQPIDHISVHDILPAEHPNKGMKGTDEAIKYFSDERIRDIFSHPYFSLPKSKDTSHYRSGHFWIPLIGLFTGMRVGECSQLHTQDILQVHGVWCFWVNGDVGKRSDRRVAGKRVKTANSIRYVPIHQTLLDLGLLDYVTKMAELGSKVLFPTIDWGSTDDGKTDNYKNTAMRCFNQMLKHSSAYQKGESFHLLRHTFITKMRVDLNIPEHEIAMYVGHLDQSEMAIKGRRLMTRHYGGQKGLTESELLKMHNTINRIQFDLPLTCEHWHDFSANKMRGIYTREQLDKQLEREDKSLEAAKAREARKVASIAG
ncbi:hypothetical protein GCM10022394_27220 [Zobellella aerophila]|uniref:Tyr recombinase domain-containing protein n=1 Tax=Zobellella aerophila TaxID=870480 RepID=A0ABP6W6H3_9GAMM